MSATPHSDVAKDITHQLKYARTKAAIDPMVAAMNQRCLIDPEAIITFAPAATNRVRMRGYDQSYLLAKSLGRVCGHPVVPLIARMHNTRQVGSSGQQRRVQQQDAFRVINAHAAANQKILIVDDVITTGSTLQACAALLAAAGARKVDACTFAQA